MIIEDAKKVLRIEADAIASLIERVNENFVKAVEAIYSCKGKVVVTGMGKSGIIGKKIAATLASTGTPAFFLHPAEGIHGDIGMVARGDVVIAISNSGETEELNRIVPVIKRLDIKLISFTGASESSLAKVSDIVIDVSVKEEACPMGLVPTASTTATLAMGDALVVALLEKRGIKEEDFAFFHPGGSLGKKLLLTVGDLMHTGKSIPVVYVDTPVKDAIFEISSKRLGITCVIDRRGELRGVITDGDLRRLIEKDINLLNEVTEKVMTKNPKIIQKDALAAKAVAVMEQYSITSLIIVDEEEKPEGIIHLHDLLKAGVV
ncbi:MAG: KpsF/GutQ family sugar-phosphate isomerase [Nitrospirota bacterium]